MRPVLLALTLALSLPCVASAELAPEAARAWLRHVVPLPQEVQLAAARTVPRGAVRVIAPEADASAVARSAVAELRRAVGECHGAPQATIRLVLGGASAQRLRDLPSPEQAYRVRSRASGRELVVAALQPPGLYYGAVTLAQLIDARAGGDSLQLPVLTVTDWPDMPDRGLWGSDNFLEVEWMARRKLNLIEQISWLHVTPDGRGEAHLKPGREPMVELAPSLAMRPAPVILHLEQLSGKGLFEASPGLRAEGGAEGAICYSQPEIIDVLADWMVELGSLPGVGTIDVWMAENLHGQGGCQCEQCAAHNRSALEARIIVAAWRRARERVPHLGLRVMTSEETAGSNEAVIAELPPEVGLSYYHSLLTYTALERPMIPPLIARAAEDRWVAVVPSLVASVGLAQPFTGAQFVHSRMTEFISRGLSGWIGYATPRVKYAWFNVEAAAEWSWNASGRTPREFALSWAVRNGYSEPELFAEWAETLGPVTWDVYGSEWPAGMRRNHPGPVAELLREGELPELGEVKWGVFPAPWGDIKSEEQLRADVRAAGLALDLARRLDDPQFLQETLVARGYIEALAALHQLKLLAPDGRIAPERRGEAARQFRRYLDALGQSGDALPLWADAVDPEEGARFAEAPVTLLEEMTARMRATAAEMNVPLQ
ncbi:MAG: glycoside hydrolase family 20 zincin-like fold domain-containing protein [Armatimonadota bacterium]|nr:glycoside hydrolase family 20 zincin-like fold domain-containing protein [Armatimonadota bacterium]